jgi:hypothetical protein
MGDEHEIPRPAGPCMHAGAMMRPALPRRARRRRHDHAAVPPPLARAGERGARGATNGAASFRTPDIASRPSPSPPRAFVIAFVRRHSAPPWRIGGPGSGRRKPRTHRSIESGSEHDSGCRCICMQFCMCASCNVTVTRPSRARACQFQSAGRQRQNDRRELIMAWLRRIHSALVWACSLLVAPLTLCYSVESIYVPRTHHHGKLKDPDDP